MSLSVILSKPNPNMIPKGKGSKSGQKQPDNEGTDNPTSIFDGTSHEITELSCALFLKMIMEGKQIAETNVFETRSGQVSVPRTELCILSGLVERHDICENLQKLQKLEIV